MKVYRAEQIRNVALISHVGAGKTSLVDAALYDSGAVTRQGRVDEGSSVADYDPDELKSWWTKQWPRAYALLAPKDAEVQPTEYAYQSDYQWFQTWMSYQVESRQS